MLCALNEPWPACWNACLTVIYIVCTSAAVVCAVAGLTYGLKYDSERRRESSCVSDNLGDVSGFYPSSVLPHLVVLLHSKL